MISNSYCKIVRIIFKFHANLKEGFLPVVLRTNILRTFSSSKGREMENDRSSDLSQKLQSDNKVASETESFVLTDIVIDKTPDTIVTEGKAVISFPSSHDVFYNPVQEFNRDLSIAVMKQFVKTVPTTARGLYAKLRKNKAKIEISVLEALAASGLRSIRYAKEVEGLASVVANDMSHQAYESIVRNVKNNDVKHIVSPSKEDAVILMYKNRKKFDIVDLDPYGTPSIFLDAAVQTVVDGGLLMVTCTDMAVLCGNVMETCHAKYGAISAKVSYCHEMALRIVLQCIEINANKYGRYIEPVLSVSADFYVRLFVRIFSGAKICKQSVRKLSRVYICQGCKSFYLQPLGVTCPTEKSEKFTSTGPPVDRTCDICNCNFKVYGPIWSANIHDKEFVFNMLQMIEEEPDKYKTSKRMLGMLNVILEELDDSPLYHKMDRLFSTVHVCSPTIVQFRSALLHAGYKVSLSHALPSSIKTNAPQHVTWDIVRAWAKQNMGKKTLNMEPSKFIMSRDSSIEVSFTPRADANPESRTSGLLRFQVNPEPNWGPKARAKTSLNCDALEEKRIKMQNKKKKKEDSEEQELDSKCKKLKSEDSKTQSCGNECS